MGEITKLPDRQSIRLPRYDYTQEGAYFVTIATHEKKYLFGEVIAGVMELSALGKQADDCWLEIPRHFPNVELPRHVVMPNHVHGIIVLRGKTTVAARPQEASATRESFAGPVQGSLPTIVRSFKSAVSRAARRTLRRPALQIWKRSYFEHVIRNEDDYRKTFQYICENPMRWEFDSENPFGRPREELNL
jgi:putative transposase